MSIIKCASFITTTSAEKNVGNTGIRTSRKLGRMVYGCDFCQDVCPHNKGKLKGMEEFPGLRDVVPHMSAESIMSMSYEEIDSKLSKYWYINQRDLWKWKLNALAFMMNNYNESHKEFIELGLRDTDKRVRAFARKVLKGLRK